MVFTDRLKVKTAKIVLAALAPAALLSGFIVLGAAGMRPAASFYIDVLLLRAAGGGGASWSSAVEISPGIEHARFFSRSPGPAVVNAVRIDLSTPGVGFYSTPPCESFGTEGEWTDSAGRKWRFTKKTEARRTRDFMAGAREAGVNMVAAVNAGSGWTPFDSGTLPFRPPSPECVEPAGVLVSSGKIISLFPQPSFIVERSGAVRLGFPPGDGDLSGIETAVGGRSWCLMDGVPQAPCESETKAPRSAVGISKDGRYVYFVAVDGRRLLSRGVSLSDLGVLLLELGAHSALNMDGGGSTTLAARDPGSGSTRVLNTPSDGWFMLSREREVSCSLGVYVENSN